MSCSTGEVLIQRHVEPSPANSFNRSWAEFKNGFCDSSGNFWIGNDRLHDATKIQNPTRRQLRVVLTDTNGNVGVVFISLIFRLLVVAVIVVVAAAAVLVLLLLLLVVVLVVVVVVIARV